MNVLLDIGCIRRMEPKKEIMIIVATGLVRKDNKLLLVQRHEPENPDAHMKWEWPGGKVDYGESPEQAVIREIEEETGYKTKVVRMIPLNHYQAWDYPQHLQHTIVLGFECELISDEQKEVNEEQIHDIKWHELENIEKLDLLSGTKEFLNKL